MFSRRLPIVDNQRKNNVPRRRFAVGNILGPSAGAGAVARKSGRRITVTKTAAGLLGAMIGSSAGHSARCGERTQRLGVAKKADCFVDGARSFMSPDTNAIRQRNR